MTAGAAAHAQPACRRCGAQVMVILVSHEPMSHSSGWHNLDCRVRPSKPSRGSCMSTTVSSLVLSQLERLHMLLIFPQEDALPWQRPDLSAHRKRHESVITAGDLYNFIATCLYGPSVRCISVELVQYRADLSAHLGRSCFLELVHRETQRTVSRRVQHSTTSPALVRGWRKAHPRPSFRQVNPVNLGLLPK